MKNKVQKIINKALPYIRMHGGDVFIIEVKDGIVKLKITGNCVHCSLADLTYNKMLGSIIKEEIPKIKEVIIES